ncbi:MAG: zinc ABC transporter substrate-binding protein [bacterium]
MGGSRQAMKLQLILALAALAGTSMAGCSASEPTPDVMATFYPLAFLAQQIGGGNVTVGSIVKDGVEPHDYEPTPADVNAITDARLVVLQGAGFESWIGNVHMHASVRATAGLDLRENPSEDERASLPNDPHTWMDPPMYARMARNVEDAMVQVFPEKAAGLHARAAALVARIDALDGEFRSGLAHCSKNAIITGHAAFGYMARDYGFEQIAISGLDPESEPDSATINHVIDEARARNITVIFFEDQVNPALVNTIANEVHAETRILSPIEAIPAGKLAAGADYITVQHENLANLRHAMQCA